MVIVIIIHQIHAGCAEQTNIALCPKSGVLYYRPHNCQRPCSAVAVLYDENQLLVTNLGNMIKSFIFVWCGLIHTADGFATVSGIG